MSNGVQAKPGREFGKRNLYHSDLVAKGAFRTVLLEIREYRGYEGAAPEWKAKIQPPGDQQYFVMVARETEAYFHAWQAIPTGREIMIQATGSGQDGTCNVTWGEVTGEMAYQPPATAPGPQSWTPSGPAPAAAPAPFSPAPAPAPGQPQGYGGDQPGGRTPPQQPAPQQPAPANGIPYKSALETEIAIMAAATHVVARFFDLKGMSKFEVADVLLRTTSHLVFRQERAKTDRGVDLPLTHKGAFLEPVPPWHLRHGAIVYDPEAKEAEPQRAEFGQLAILRGLLESVKSELEDEDRIAVEEALNDEPPPLASLVDEMIQAMTKVKSNMPEDDLPF